MAQIKPVKAAVIGCGTISHIYMSNFKKFAVIDLVGCSDIIPERAQKRAEEFGVSAMTNQEILSNPEIEMVMNLTFPEAHYEVSRRILEAGKHCCVEKMMTVNFGEALELTELAKKKNLLYCAAPDTFLGGGWQSARKYIDDGFIGKPIGVAAVISCSYQPDTDTFDLDPDHFFFPLHPGGGLPFDLGGYYLHNMINLFGPVNRVSGFGGNIDPDRMYRNPSHPRYKEPFQVDTPTTLSGTLEFKSGVYGVILITSDASVYDSFSVHGSEASLHLFHPNWFSGPLILHRSGAVVDEERDTGKNTAEGYRPIPDQVRLPILHGYGENSRGLAMADMAYALRNNRRPRAHFDLGLHAMEIIHGMLESGRTGKVYRMATGCERPKPLRAGVKTGNAQEAALDD
ncbi:MAG: Gfo/Idh/MocA family oxidoreductase [Treponema sp.]|jgi:predicted dehydrogenase|nr:Gfo/Idh/MocA family oxidoreductase [Treponema sp.]